MTEEELNQYIAEQLGDQRLQALTVSNWRSLRARYFASSLSMDRG